MLGKTRALLNRPSGPFQVVSDLHLEINQQYSSFEIPCCANHLILAGDIGCFTDYNNYRDFLQRQTDQFELVFLVLGNHEFYNGTFAEGLAKARQLEREPCLKGRLIILHQRRYDVPGSHITILGCTLWSKVPREARDIVQAKIKDFQNIESWTIDDHNAAHDEDRAWLRDQIQSIQRENRSVVTQDQKRSILVVTHHAPSLSRTSSPQHTGSPWRFGFGTDILSPAMKGVDVWIFGHTHYTTEFQEEETRVLSNQRGYVLPGSDSQKKKDGFDVRKVIHV